jgi:hypothetical protein
MAPCWIHFPSKHFLRNIVESSQRSRSKSRQKSTAADELTTHIELDSTRDTLVLVLFWQNQRQEYRLTMETESRRGKNYVFQGSVRPFFGWSLGRRKGSFENHRSKQTNSHDQLNPSIDQHPIMPFMRYAPLYGHSWNQESDAV